ncbi:glycosidase [Arthrobacter sp.]|uniref:pullulanase X25 domain-containing protein n=1 Tax=Arthrobacter sp. TaxID=1667 RepID=UPI0028125DF4|nr:glycosidase [Arthrobacter sp.]
MGNTAENTNLRLKAVLEVLAEGVWSGESANAGAVLGEATARVPFNEHEGVLLSGGIPRGHKTLTSATAKLVKAGWLVKGRSGWTITDDGLRATVAFPDASAFGTALDAGTPVPADLPVPTVAPAHLAAKKTTPKKAEDKKPAARKAAKVADKVQDKATQLIEDVVKPVAKAVRTRKPAAKKSGSVAPTAVPDVDAASADHTAPAITVETFGQPEAVAVAGDFNTLLGAPDNWAPQYDEVQLELDQLDQLWKLSADLPAGYYTFKIALNRSWDENYGAFGAFDGANHELHHAGGPLTIQYDHRTHDIRYS